ncbi:MAG: dihydroorotate dehydrogenase (quinone) [Candidatus Bathyarchaeia archaeon]
MPLNLYESIARPALFLTSPETAHGIAKVFFTQPLIWQVVRSHLTVDDESLRVNVGPLSLKTPVGLAAGFDKNCEMMSSLFCMGFGYLTLGTVTAERRDGNPKPRMWRYRNRSLLNSMGLPNNGSESVAENILKARKRNGALILSISGLSIDEFSLCYRKLDPLADGIELNISTPNTMGVRIFQDAGVLDQLLNSITKIRSERPLWVKIPPYFNGKERENVLGLVDICRKNSVDGITAINTKRIPEERSSIGTAGLSGKEIFEDMLRIVRDVYRYTGGKLPINACGGIFSGIDAWQAFESGASSVQLYTGLIYRGPGIIAGINRELIQLVRNANLKSIGELTGAKVR